MKLTAISRQNPRRRPSHKLHLGRPALRLRPRLLQRLLPMDKPRRSKRVHINLLQRLEAIIYILGLNRDINFNRNLLPLYRHKIDLISILRFITRLPGLYLVPNRNATPRPDRRRRRRRRWCAYTVCTWRLDLAQIAQTKGSDARDCVCAGEYDASLAGGDAAAASASAFRAEGGSWECSPWIF